MKNPVKPGPNASKIEGESQDFKNINGQSMDSGKLPGSWRKNLVVFPMDIRKADDIRCSSGIGNDCSNCESCVLKRKLIFSRQWVERISETKKQKYIRSLLLKCSSMELISSLLGLLQPLQYKDFTYAKSKVSSTFDCELSSSANSSDRSMDGTAISCYMLDDERWFLAASSWAKFNYLLNIFKFCNSFTLDNIKSFLAKQYERERKRMMGAAYGSIRESTDETIRFGSAMDQDYSMNMDRNNKKSVLSFDSSNLRPSHSTVQFSPNLQQIVDERGSLLESDESIALRSTPVSSRVQFQKRSQHSSHLSARCCPYTGERALSKYESLGSDTDQYLSCELDDLGDSVGPFETRTTYSAVPKQRDFIRRLPVHISKYILGYLDPHSLINCVCVSKHWRVLAEEVRNEMLAQQITREDIMLIQGSTENIPNPVYARIIPLHVPRITEDGDYIPNDQARHVDVTCEEENFENQNMQDCYDGIETISVDVEARHVYCGAYNVLVLNNMKDAHRFTFYDGGKHVPVASVDRRIRLLDVKSGRCEKIIVEHVGSVKSVCTDEERGFVLSGSFDTTIRFWDIKTGRCQRIFLGHKSSVISLSLGKKYLATGSTDKTCKVWNLSTGKCIRTFRHRNIIHSVSIGEQLLLTGCAGGKVRVWNFKQAQLVKSLDGHMGPITCTSFDENHIVTGSKDCYAMLWSAKGNYKRCLQTFRHPKEVNCLEMMYCRIITGSVDGKIRVWNLLNGECLRIIRGNSRNDPITALYASENRLVINTKSNLLLYNFEAVDWDYNAPTERISDFVRKMTLVAEDRQKKSHAFNRAQAMRRGDSEFARTNALLAQSNSESVGKSSGCLDRGKRANSAPMRKYSSNSMQKHIARIHSAITVRKELIEQDTKHPPTKEEYLRGIRKGKLKNNDIRSGSGKSANMKVMNAWGAVPEEGLLHAKSPVKIKDDETGSDLNKQRVMTRSRSAPAHRIRTLPGNVRGFTSSSDVNVKVWESKLNVSTPVHKNRIRPFSASLLAMQNPAETHSDLKLKTFYQQLQYEANLAGKT